MTIDGQHDLCGPWAAIEDLCCPATPLVTAIDDWTGYDPTDPGSWVPAGGPLTDEQRTELLAAQTALDTATQFLFDRSCGRYPGTCTAKVGPACSNPCAPRRCYEPCADLLDLGEMRWQILTVTEVNRGGVVEDLGDYAVQDGRWVAYLGDDRAPWTESDDWDVSVTYGMDPPHLGPMAARELACRMLPCVGDDCEDLPPNATSMSRGGITFRLASPIDAARNAETGVYLADLFIGTYGCDEGLDAYEFADPAEGRTLTRLGS